MLEHQKVEAVIITHVEDGANVLVRQRGDRPGFALEALTTIGCVTKLCWQHLDGDDPI